MSEETVPQMRERIEALEKQAKDATTAAQAAESRARLFEARDAFRTKGLKPEYAELFLGAHQGDITPDAVDGFVDKFGFQPESTPPPADDSAKGAETNPPASSTLSAFSRAGSSVGEGGQQTPGTTTMTREDWNELNKKDRGAARAVLARGGVQIRKDNIYAQKTT